MPWCWLHPLNQTGNQLDAGLCLAFHQEDDALGEHFVVHQLALLEFEVGCPLQVVICLVEIFLLDLDFGDLIQSLACQMVVVVGSDDLLKVQDRVAQVVQLLQRFRLVEVGFAQSW